MNRLPLLALAFLCVGCTGIKRLTEGTPAGPQETLVIRGGQLGPMPTFNVPTPAGYTRTVLHEFLPANGVVTGLASSQLNVFMLDEVSHQWFHLGTSYSGAWYYTVGDKSITVHGNTLAKKEICIYQYVGEDISDTAVGADLDGKAWQPIIQ